VHPPSVLFCELFRRWWRVFAIDLSSLRHDTTEGDWVQAYFCAQELSYRNQSPETSEQDG